MKIKKFAFVVLLFFSSFSAFSLDASTYLNILPEALSFEFLSVNDTSKLSSLPASYTNFIELVGYQNLASNEYLVFVNSEVYSRKTSLFIPLVMSFDEFLETFGSKFTFEDVSKEGRTLKKIKELGLYVSKEEGNYVGISQLLDVLLKNKVSTLDSSSVESLRSVILKGISEEYVYFSYASTKKISETFSVSISNIAKYNFLEDLDFLEIYSKDGRVYQGKLHLKSRDRMKLVYTPKVVRNINIEFMPKNDFLLSFSVNPNFVADLIEAFYPDISKVSPSLISDLKKTISGTFAASYNLDNFDRVKRDFVVVIGIKSKGQAERFLKSFLGLSKYKRINVSGYQLYEITLTQEGKEEKFYITYTDKEYVIALQSNYVVNFLESIKKGNKNYTFANFVPMVYLDMIADRDLRNFQDLLILPSKGQRVVLSIEPDESLKFISVYAELSF